MPGAVPHLPRVRQVVLAAGELEPVAERLQAELGLGEPFSDPGVGYFGLRNAVFALGDTFIEIVSPVREDTAAGRLLVRRGGDCGYMVMFQVDDLSAARTRAAAAGVREVFEVELEDISEAHLHPADMRGAIVSISSPRPVHSWRWAGPDWEQRSAVGAVIGVTVAVADPEAVSERWSRILGGSARATFVADTADRGLVEVELGDRPDLAPVVVAGVRFTAHPVR